MERPNFNTRSCSASMGYFAKMLNQRSKAHKKESAYCDQEDRFFSFLIIL